MFKEMIRSIQEDTVKYIYNAQVNKPPKREKVAKLQEPTGGDRQSRKQGCRRNDPCPCGSGCGKNVAEQMSKSYERRNDMNLNNIKTELM